MSEIRLEADHPAARVGVLASAAKKIQRGAVPDSALRALLQAVWSGAEIAREEEAQLSRRTQAGRLMD